MELQFLALSFFLSSLFCYLLFQQYSNRHKNLPPSPPFKLPLIGHMHLLGPLLHQTLHNFSLKYGPLISLNFGSVLCVVASSPHFAKQLLQNNELSFNSRIQTTAIKRLTYDSSLAFAPYGDYWRFIKKLSMNELLGSRSINNFQHLRAQETQSFMTLLANKAKTSEIVNITEELLKLTNNVISKMMLGEVEEAREVVRGVTEIFGEFNVSDFIWLFKKVDFQGFGKRVEDLFHKFDTLVERIICKREETRKKNKGENSNRQARDFLDILLDFVENQNSDVKIQKVHIKALIMDFFTAGTDTTAISTEWALVELIKNPSIMRQAREEIDKIVGKNREVEESDVPNLPYLQAIIKETYRLHPPVAMVTRSCVTECKVENYVIPENTLLFVNVWSIGRNPEIWKKPLEFRPERFLKNGEGDSVDVRGQHFQLLPFGSGRRMCPGVSLAMQEVPALLGAIIQCFDFKVVDHASGEILNDVGDIDVDERPGLTAPRARDLLCVPVERIKFKAN
ncbi:licodione synthase-like [Vicia villosa]|uniref:licodione synthase-like n=1 Tax=Vicia villosa TaxID=3911 RepID=UPI00273C4BC7|nr:licodione synthase-like [Vicia villosa]